MGAVCRGFSAQLLASPGDLQGPISKAGIFFESTKIVASQNLDFTHVPDFPPPEHLRTSLQKKYLSKTHAKYIIGILEFLSSGLNLCPLPFGKRNTFVTFSTSPAPGELSEALCSNCLIERHVQFLPLPNSETKLPTSEVIPRDIFSPTAVPGFSRLLQRIIEPWHPIFHQVSRRRPLDRARGATRGAGGTAAGLNGESKLLLPARPFSFYGHAVHFGCPAGCRLPLRGAPTTEGFSPSDDPPATLPRVSPPKPHLSRYASPTPGVAFRHA